LGIGMPYLANIAFDWYSCSFMVHPLSYRNASIKIIPPGFSKAWGVVW
jgi:hypothetical protein